ncbi:hypothetical protein JTB14_010932 [Gonioctena quinquepunctata]|nr:hypothetical protein JTB14_010932 [Gonioctena quinquepunctata]
MKNPMKYDQIMITSQDELQRSVGKVVGEEEKQKEDKEYSGKLGKVVRKTKRIAGPDDCFDNKNEKHREQGKNYIGWETEGKKRRRGGNIKGERTMGPPCNSTFCKKSRVRESGKLPQKASIEPKNFHRTKITDGV